MFALFLCLLYLNFFVMLSRFLLFFPFLLSFVNDFLRWIQTEIIMTARRDIEKSSQTMNTSVLVCLKHENLFFCSSLLDKFMEMIIFNIPYSSSLESIADDIRLFSKIVWNCRSLERMNRQQTRPADATLFKRITLLMKRISLDSFVYLFVCVEREKFFLEGVFLPVIPFSFVMTKVVTFSLLWWSLFFFFVWFPHLFYFSFSTRSFCFFYCFDIDFSSSRTLNERKWQHQAKRVINIMIRNLWLSEILSGNSIWVFPYLFIWSNYSLGKIIYQKSRLHRSFMIKNGVFSMILNFKYVVY